MQFQALAPLLILLMLVPASAAAQDQPAQKSAEPANPSALDSTPPVPPEKGHFGGRVEPASIIKQVNPKYPAAAKRAKICGIVTLHATIAKDGSVHDLSYVSGPPMLMKAALDAVGQWRYSTTLLEGRPVEVDITINVDFELKGCKPTVENAPPQTQSTPPTQN